jgi:hypothetical protein
MACDVQRVHTQPFWGPEGRGKDAVTAYEAAKLQLKHMGARWATLFKEQLTCPEGCKDPHGFRYSIEEIAVDGYFRWRGEICVFHIRARLHAQWVCDPVQGARPTNVPEIPLPGETQPPPPSIETPTAPVIGPPCEITIAMQDLSTMSGIGVFDWTIDLRFEASSDNPAHSWPPGSCIVRDIVFQRRHGTGSGTADAILNFLSGVAGQKYHLKDPHYQLTVVDGAGYATINGVLLRGASGLPLDATFAPAIYVTIEAIDSNGDPKLWVSPAIIPHP